MLKKPVVLVRAGAAPRGAPPPAAARGPRGPPDALDPHRHVNISDSGAGSLRQAIDNVNGAGGGTIDFDIPSGLQKIELQSALPPITVPVYIDGLSQPSSTANTPLIQIDGTDAGASATGLTLDNSASGSTVSGLLITDFSDGGVLVNGASNVNLSDLVVGATEISGNIPVDAGNNVYGVFFLAGSNNTLSGSVVSANMGDGVQIDGESGDLLTGDFIGTDVNGMRQVDAFGNPLGNSYDGRRHLRRLDLQLGNRFGHRQQRQGHRQPAGLASTSTARVRTTTRSRATLSASTPRAPTPCPTTTG